MATTITKPRIGAWSEERVLREFRAEILRRGGRDELLTTKWAGARHPTRTPLAILDRADGMVLLGAAQWHQSWKRAPGRMVKIAYLCGWDDNGLWAAAVPGPTATVADALNALTPAYVQGREHVRQGDIYLVRMERASATTPSGTIRDSHLWDADTRTLTHVPVKPVEYEVETEYEVCGDCWCVLSASWSRCHCRPYNLPRTRVPRTGRSTRTRLVVDEEAARHAPVTAPADWPGVKVVEQNRHNPAHPTAD